MLQNSSPLRRMTEAAVIAAMYAALSLAVPALSFGPVQLRISELLTILPVLTPAAVPGLTLGCFLTNLLGMTLGANIAGAWDILFGTAATLAAALLTRQLRHLRVKGLPVVSALPPVLLNAVVIGLELTLVMTGGFDWTVFGICVAEVGAGELGAALIGGLVLYAVLSRVKFFK